MRIAGLEPPKFCDCGSIMRRGTDGVWKCSNGHTISDATTTSMQQTKAYKTRMKIEENTRLLSSALQNTNEDIFVFQLVNPFREKQKDGLTPNPSSFKVYEELHDLERKYPATKFKYLRGDIFGTKASKYGHIICTKDVVADVKSDIEKIKLFEYGHEEGHYILNQYETLKDVPKEIISKIGSEIEDIKTNTN